MHITSNINPSLMHTYFTNNTYNTAITLLLYYEAVRKMITPYTLINIFFTTYLKLKGYNSTPTKYLDVK